MNGTDKKKLKAYVESVAEKLKAKKELDDEIAEIVAEAADKLGLRKGNIRKAARESLMDDLERADKQQVEEELDQMRHALGLLADTPLGEAAVANGKKGTVRKIAEEAGATF